MQDATHAIKTISSLFGLIRKLIHFDRVEQPKRRRKRTRVGGDICRTRIRQRRAPCRHPRNRRTRPVTAKCRVDDDIHVFEIRVNVASAITVECDDGEAPRGSVRCAGCDVRGDVGVCPEPDVSKRGRALSVVCQMFCGISRCKTYSPDDSHCIAYTPPPLTLKASP